MKKRLLLLLTAVTAACQHQAPPTAVVAHAPATTAQPVASPQQPVPADSLAPEAAALLRQHDLAPLWANQTEGTLAPHAMEGFYGLSHYRISFYFSKVARDAQRPNVFYVEGLDRYKKVVTPFAGTITVQAIQPFTSQMFVDADSIARAYTVVSRFELWEDPATKGAGTYYGKALLDFYVNAQGHLNQALALMADGGSENPTKGSGLLFTGYQVSNQTHRRQPVAFANFHGAVVPQALSKLHLGERSEEVNPSLAKLGWNEAWENDEWWADVPKPSLNL